MSNFINTIDVMGQEAFIDSFIERTLTEFKDEYITKIGANAFCSCPNLKIVDLLSVIEEIGGGAFMSCSNLDTLILRNEEIPVNAQHNTAEISIGASWLNGTKIANGEGYVYVPKALVTPYGNLSYVTPSWLRALEDYTVDGTITGELDESKIAA